MQKLAINPWQWQKDFGFSQAVNINGGQQILYCAGQAATNSSGTVQHHGDMRAQVQLALSNLQDVLSNGGYSWHNVVRLTIYTMDIDRFFDEYGEVMLKFAATETKPAITVVGVTRLGFHGLMVEIEATAVK